MEFGFPICSEISRSSARSESTQAEVMTVNTSFRLLSRFESLVNMYKRLFPNFEVDIAAELAR